MAEEKMKQYVCVCLWPPVTTPCPNYEVVGFQPQAVDIPDLGSVHPPQYIFNTHYIEYACQ